MTALVSAMTHTTTMRLHHSKGHYSTANVFIVTERQGADSIDCRNTLMKEV